MNRFRLTRFTRRAWVGALATVAVALGGTVVAVSPAGADTTAGNWSSLVSGFAAGGRVTLGSDVSASDGATLAVASGSTVTLDLHGHALSITNAARFAAAISVPEGATFSVVDSATGGRLTVTGGTAGGAGIGGNGMYHVTRPSPGDAGTITISGGTITASGGLAGAGIGGGGADSATGEFKDTNVPGGGGGTVTISGGTVHAYGGDGAAGIGGGSTDSGRSLGGAGATVSVTGGAVDAHGSNGAAGIGGGRCKGVGGTSGTGGALTVSTGADVSATGGSGAGAANGQSAAGPGVGGGAGTHPIGNGGDGATVQVLAGGTLHAVGAAAVGGGTQGKTKPPAIPNPPALPHGSDGAFGMLVNAGTLYVPSGSTLTVPNDITVKNSGTIYLAGSLAGTGTVINDGTITGGPGTSLSAAGGSVAGNGAGPAGSALAVTDRNYTLALNPLALGSSPSTMTVFAQSIRSSNQTLPTPSGPAGTVFGGWFSSINKQVIDLTLLSAVFGGSGPGVQPLYAHYLLPPVITSAATTSFTVGNSNTFTVSAFGNPTPAITESGSLPSGVAFHDNGNGTATLSGTAAAGAAATTGISFTATSAAGSTTQSFTLIVAKQPQQITVTAGAPAQGRPGDVYRPQASAPGGTVSVTIDDTTDGHGTDAAACVLANELVRLQRMGSCVIDFDQAGNSTYAPATTVRQTIAVSQRAQQIDVASQTPQPGYVGDTYTPTATAPGGDVTIAADPSTQGYGTDDATCTVAGGVTRFERAGTCVIAFDQSGNDEYAAAPTITQLIDVARRTQEITVTSEPADTTYVGDTYTPRADAPGGEVAVSVDPRTDGWDTDRPVCRLDSGTVTFTLAGACVIAFDQAGNDEYEPARFVTQTVVATRRDQVITIVNDAPSPAHVGDTFVPQLDAPGGAVTISIDPDTDGFDTDTVACTTDGMKVTFAHSGACVLDFDQPGDDEYHAAATNLAVNVTKREQSIVETSGPPAIGYPGMTYTPEATAEAGAVRIAVSASTDGFGTDAPACSGDGTTITLMQPGTCIIELTQDGDDTYEPAPTVYDPIKVERTPAAVGVDLSPPAAVYGQPVRATATVWPAFGAADGAVQFLVNGRLVGAPAPVNNDGTASIESLLIDGQLSPGSPTVTAVYTPTDAALADTGEGGSTLGIAKAASTTSVHAAAATVSAHVSAVSPGAGTPTGIVTFSVDGSDIGTARLVDGAATLTQPATGARAVTAAYEGDDDFDPSSDSTSPTGPSITAAINSARPPTTYGWYRDPVTITFTCTARTAPLTSTCPHPAALRADGAGQSVSRTITATDGGVATVVTPPVNIDRTRPTVSIDGVRDGARYTGTVPAAGCAASDALSGVASCELSVRTRAARNATVYVYTATATDKADNVRATTARVTLARAGQRH